ncbi:MAG: cytochrome c biogenesis protein CcsA [Nitrospirae bacterium]|nr:cytochrome c biogenesis protein CcsA [Candidatus Manganitrophaceae bacterium]
MRTVLFFKITLLFYFLGTAFFLINLWDRKGERTRKNPLFGDAATRSPWSQRLAVLLTAAGFIAHTGALVMRIRQAGYVPFTSLHEAISFFSWAIVLVFFLVEFRYGIDILGSFILPLAFLSLVSAAALPDEIRTIDPSLTKIWLGIHTTFSLLGIVAFAIAFIAGIMYLLQESFLKSKQFNALYYKLPSLDLLDEWNKKAILLGFPLLTLGIISGALWAQYSFGSFWTPTNPKQVLSLGTWLFYLMVLHGRITIGWRAKKAAHLAIIGFVGALFIFVTLA